MSKPKKAPCIDVRTDIHKDERVKVLAELAGYNHYEAIGRLHALWSWCRDRGLQDTRPDADGYFVSEAVVRRFLGPNGVQAILGDDVDEFALAVRSGNAELYLRGTSEYVSAARAHAATSSAGGQARAREPRDERGQYVGKTTNVQPEPQPGSAHEPAESPPDYQPTPASSSSLFPLPSFQSQSSHTPARAIHPVSAAAKLAMAFWDECSRRHSELKAEGIDAGAIGWGQPFGGAWDRCRDRVKELLEVFPLEEAEKLLANVLEVRTVEARTKLRHLKFFVPMRFFDADSFAIARSLTPEQVTAADGKGRAGPRSSGDLIGAATPRTDHPISPTLIPINEL